MAIGQQPRARKLMASPASDKTPAVSRGRGFLHEVIVELKKTTWPTPAEAWRLTVVVMSVIIVIALYMGAIDRVLTFLTAYFHLIK
jgi:preprotein translocase subunit SecE